jgi:6-phosphofructo-2-kinase/fructose-2,6-biphosphatase
LVYLHFQHYRYPHGESYIDLIQRLEPVIFELERMRTPVLVVAHQGVLRALFAYFLDIEQEKIPFIPVSQHAVYKFVPQAYGCQVSQHQLIEIDE